MAPKLSEQAASAFKGLQGYYSGDIYDFRTPEDYNHHSMSLEDITSYFLADLMFFCKETGINFDGCLARAKYHYGVENSSNT